MAIIKMKQLQLLAMRSDREKLLHVLQSAGCVELCEPSADTEEAVLLARLTQPDGQKLSQAQTRRQEAERAVEILKRYGAKGRGFLTPRPQTSQEALCRPEAEARQDQAVSEVLEEESKEAALTAQLEKLAAQRAVLAPWLSLDLPLESMSTQEMLVQLGTLTATRPYEEAVEAVESASELAYLTQVSVGRELRYCLVACHVSAQEAVLGALREFGWSPINLQGWTGTAQENDRCLEQEQADVQAERKKVREKLAAMSDRLDSLYQAVDRAALDVHREESRVLLRDTEQTFFLQGWVPAERWEELRKNLEPFSCAYTVKDPTEEEYPQVPVQLKNNWFTRPLNMVTEMYSLPAYGTVDPNPLMAPFFILFYGIMMADMAYGLLMILLGALLRFKKHAEGTLGHMGGLLLLCGISTFIMGVITGGFLGDFVTQLTTLLNPNVPPVTLPALFTPLNDTMMVLIGALCLGLVQIVTGMAISVIQKVKDGRWMDAFWEEITWWIVFLGIALMALGVTPAVLCVGFILVITGPLIHGKGIGKLTGIFGSLYNHITGYFGDILSYSRLMALMLAGSVIAQVFNTLGTIAGNAVVFVVVSLVGNGLNFLLNLLSCYVHDLRLQCLEYFNKFYQDGGKPFMPLDLRTKYYEVVK